MTCKPPTTNHQYRECSLVQKISNCLSCALPSAQVLGGDDEEQEDNTIKGQFPDMQCSMKKVINASLFPNRLADVFRKTQKGLKLGVTTLCSGSDGVIQCLEDGHYSQNKLWCISVAENNVVHRVDYTIDVFLNFQLYFSNIRSSIQYTVCIINL